MSIREIQAEHAAWSKKNFPNAEPWMPILGVIEEVGELAHAYLKRAQGIRGTQEQHTENMQDAVGDVVIFLMDFCTRHGFDLEEIIETTWEEVKQRDWEKNPENGVLPKEVGS